MKMGIARAGLVSVAALSTIAAAVAVGSPAHAASTTDRISRNSQGQQGNCQSQNPSTAANGRLITFESCASNLVRDDPGPWGDVFLRNRTTGKTTRLSEKPNGVQGNGGSGMATISATGRFVVFRTGASNLATPDRNSHADVVRLDRSTGKFALVSVARRGGGNGDAGEDASAVSDNGRFVAFVSRSTNLTGNDDTNGFTDVYLRDMKKGKTVLVSRNTDGSAGGSNEDVEISGSGRYVVFESSSPTIVAGDTNGPDAFIYDRVSKEIRSLSANRTNPLGQHIGQSPSISNNGKVVAFRGISTEVAGAGQVLAVRLQFAGGVPQAPQAGDYQLVSAKVGGGESEAGGSTPCVSGNGKRVAFYSGSTDIVANDTNAVDDVFVRTLGGGTLRASVRSNGAQANGHSPAFGNAGDIDTSGTGNTVVFSSLATNLVRGDTNNTADIFAHIR